MAISQKENIQLRRYLIGALEEAEDCEVGERLLADDEYFAQMAILEEELIDDYLAGRLPRDERSLFESYFMLARSHQDKLRFAQALHKYVKAESPAASARTPAPDIKRRNWIFFFLSFRVALTAAAMILVALTGYRIFMYTSDLQKGQDLLKNLYQNERPVKSRITLLNWAPFPDKRTGQSSQPSKDELKEKSAQVLFNEALKDDPSPVTEHAFGEFKLATRDFDEAIKYLSLAVNGDPDNPAYRSDLGAALLEKGVYGQLNGRGGQGSEELNHSLEELDHALSIAADFKPALFNRALCLEAMGQWRQAEAAWVYYLEKDPNSPWALDAKKSLDLVKQQ